MTSMAFSAQAALPIYSATDCTPDDWLQRHADRISQNLDTQELIQLIVELRNYLLMQNCEIPDLTAFLDACRVSLRDDDFYISDEIFEALKREIKALDRGDSFSQVRHRSKDKKKKGKELKVNSKTAVGFLKFVAGGLLCLVPIPLVQGAGVGLAVLGVSEMADGAREQADERDKHNENQRINRELEFKHAAPQ